MIGVNAAKGQRLYEFSLAAREAVDQNEIWECLKTALSHFGVHWVNYVGGTQYAPIMQSNMSTAWLEYYAEHYMMSDFLAKYCAAYSKPVIMDTSFYRGDVEFHFEEGADFHKKNQTLFSDILHMGSYGGIGIPLSQPNSEFLKAASVLFNLGNRDTDDMIKQHGEEISLIVYAAHQLLGKVELLTGGDVFSTSHNALLKKNALLTVREKDVLRYLASGLRPDRISEKMGLQLATINLHIAKARNRLGAATREHAIVTAINTRQIIL